jgi:membrane-associated phospholipid phosphatase
VSEEVVDPTIVEPVTGVEPEAVGQPHGHLGRRNDRLLLIGILAYVILLSFLMIARGISLTPDVVVVGFGLAAIILGRGRLFLRDWIPFIALFFAYELMRGYAAKFGLPVHITDIVDIERAISAPLGQLPTTWLQSLHHGAIWTPQNGALDPLATISVIFYFLHFPLPLVVGFLLWIRQRSVYYDFVAALIVLSMAAFVTYLVLPVAPPWYAADPTQIPTQAACGGQACVTGVLHLRDTGFQGLESLFGFGNYFYSYQNVYGISSNDVAAFPSLHAAYPFLAFMFARKAFGKAGFLMLAYTACIWFAIVYLGEHWVTDIIGGVVYAAAAYFVVMHAPAWGRRFMAKLEDEELEAAVEAEGEVGALRRLHRRIRWALVVQGLAVAIIGAVVGYGMNAHDLLGGSQSALYLLPWLAILGGLWRAAAGLISR